MTQSTNIKLSPSIELILKRINASNNLRKILETILESKFLEIYENQVINALLIAESVLNKNDLTGLVASMQSGKTDTAFVLSNYILPEMGLLKSNESVLFVTSMRDKTLYNQNKLKIERDAFSFSENRFKPSNLKVEKMDVFKKIGSFILKDFNIKYIIRDEDQYGCGQESSFDLIYFKELKKVYTDLSLISISATPFDLFDSKVKGNNINIIDGDRPSNYFGVSEMLQEGNIYDLPENYKPIRISIIENKKYTLIDDVVTNSIEYLLRQDSGYGLIRVSNTNEGDILRKELKKHANGLYDTYMIGSNELNCDYSIEEGLKVLSNEVIRKNKKVVVIIIQALSAGKDLGGLKSYFRFGIESRKYQLANGAQGIPGRVCGYHENRNFIIYANKTLLTHYSEFENDPEVYADEDWRYFLMQLGKIRSISTHTNLEQTVKEGFYSDIIDIRTYGVDEIYTDDIYEELDFMGKKSIDKLRKLFTKEFYETRSKHYVLSESCSVRLASSYKDPHRLYREWDNKLGENFSKTFFRGSKKVKYGLLISNYPQTHEKNQINFTGIKVFISGEYNFKSHLTSTINRSMYVEPEND